MTKKRIEEHEYKEEISGTNFKRIDIDTIIEEQGFFERIEDILKK